MGKEQAEIFFFGQWTSIKVTSCEFVGVDIYGIGQDLNSGRMTDIIVSLEEE